MLFRNKRPRWPPSPTVEDEIASLSRELHGLTQIGDNPGFEGVCARGSIDQYPLIIETFSFTSIVQTDTLRGDGPGSSSTVDSSGPPTPPSDSKQPILFKAGNPKRQEYQPRPVCLATPPTSRDTSPRGQPRAPAPQPVRNSRPTDEIGHQTSPARPLGPSSQSSKAQKGSVPALHKSACNQTPLKAAKPSLPVRTSSLPSKPASMIPKLSESVKSGSPAGPLTTKSQQPTSANPSLAKATKLSLPVRTSSLTNKPASSIPKQSGSVRLDHPAGQSLAKILQPTSANSNPVKATKPSLPVRTSSLTNKPASSIPKQSGGIRLDHPSGQSPAKVQQPTPVNRSPVTATKPSPPVRASSLTNKSSSSIPNYTGSNNSNCPTGQAMAKIQRPFPISPSPQKATKLSAAIHNSPLPSKPSSSSAPNRSGSVKSDCAARPSATNVHQPTPATGYQSDSAANKTRLEPIPVPQGNKKPSVRSLSTLSLAERLEEKMKHRQEERDSGSSPQDAQKKPDSPTLVSTVESNSVIVVKIQRQQASQDPVVQAFRPQLPSRAVTVDPPPVKKGSRPSSLAEELIPTVVSSEKALSAPNIPKRTVSFQTEALKSASWKSPKDSIEQLPSLQLSPPQGPVRLPSPSRSSQYLPPCPRSGPVAGYQDWYTIKGMAHLDICPSCLKQMWKSKFRDVFIPGTPRSRSARIRCAMSEPWTRLAWMQTIKKQFDHLHLLCQVTQPPPGTKLCTGRSVSEQYWYRVVDPDTRAFLPKFNGCSSCVRNLRILMPPHQDTFKRCTTLQERVCDFVADSPRFVRYIDLLDMAANRAEQDHSPQPDLTEFMAYARRKVVIRDCGRSRLTRNTWYLMPQLPELTVCEDCYDDVVRPMAKASYPIARKFSTTMRQPPGDGLTRCRPASCQLYSPRMRLKFCEAVKDDDLTYLKVTAVRRYEAEQRYREHKRQLLEDEQRGYDRDEEIRRNLEEWRRWE